jgi:hypothetical protein
LTGISNTFEHGAGSLAELSQFLPTELAAWEKVVRTLGIEPE